MAHTTLKWHGDKVEKKILKGVSKNLQHAAQFLARYARQRMGVARTSKPGDYPGKKTGHLRRNVTWQKVNDLLMLWGTNVKYGKYLEEGTSKMSGRPWMTMTNEQAQKQVERIIGKPIK